MAKNPFQVLGITPEILRGLSDEEIGKIVDANFKALQGIFHPDMKRMQSDTRSKELNWAYEQLSLKRHDEQVYRAWLEAYTKRKSKKDVEQECAAQFKSLRNASEQLYTTMLEYLKSFASPNSERTVFNAAPCTLNMHDYALHLEMTDFARENDRWRNNQLFYKLVLKEDGTIIKMPSVKPKARQQVFKNKVLIGTIDEAVLKERNIHIKQLLKTAQDIYTNSDQRLQKTALAHRREHISIEEVKDFANRIYPEQFTEILPLMTPRLPLDSYLFSLNSEGSEAYFSLEGKIIRPRPQRHNVTSRK